MSWRRKKHDEKERQRKTPAIEWILAAFSAALIALTVAYLAWDTLSGPRGQPHLALETVAVEPVADGYLLRFRAHNDGRVAASSVQISGRLASGEESGVTLDYVPHGSSREGGLMFSTDPLAGGVKLRVEGYARP